MLAFTSASRRSLCPLMLLLHLGCAGKGLAGDDNAGGHGGQVEEGGRGGGGVGGHGGSTEAPAGGASAGGAAMAATAGQAGGGPGGQVAASGCAGASFCSGFEEAALPTALSFFPEYQRANQSNFAVVDAAVAHSGRNSLKVTGSEFSQMMGVTTPGERFWARVFLRSDTAIQQGHNTYVAATDGNGDPNVGQHIRVGEHQCQLELNRKSDDKELLSNGGTYSCTGGVKLEANKWYCLEVLFDGPGAEMRVFVDDGQVELLHATGWGPYPFKLFKFGFEKYHGGAKNLWYDDVAVGKDRIGCGS